MLSMLMPKIIPLILPLLTLTLIHMCYEESTPRVQYDCSTHMFGVQVLLPYCTKIRVSHQEAVT